MKIKTLFASEMSMNVVHVPSVEIEIHFKNYTSHNGVFMEIIYKYIRYTCR